MAVLTEKRGANGVVVTGKAGFIPPTGAGITVIPVVTFEVETGVVFSYIFGPKTMNDSGSDVTGIVEVGFVGGIVAVLTVVNILGFGGMTSDVGEPLGSIGRGFVADCTISGGGGKLTTVAVVGNIGGDWIVGSD